MLDPLVYAELLTARMKQSKAEAWLVNTGWKGGSYGTGTRIDLRSTRNIINAILNDKIDRDGFRALPIFNLSIPSYVEGVDESILDPSKAWESRTKWHIAATDLAYKFMSNFNKFSVSRDTAELAEYGPKV
jgi:phosphoenolpyruvate carboxykinase (ATP)